MPWNPVPSSVVEQNPTESRLERASEHVWWFTPDERTDRPALAVVAGATASALLEVGRVGRAHDLVPRGDRAARPAAAARRGADALALGSLVRRRGARRADHRAPLDGGRARPPGVARLERRGARRPGRGGRGDRLLPRHDPDRDPRSLRPRHRAAADRVRRPPGARPGRHPRRDRPCRRRPRGRLVRVPRGRGRPDRARRLPLPAALRARAVPDDRLGAVAGEPRRRLRRAPRDRGAQPRDARRRRARDAGSPTSPTRPTGSNSSATTRSRRPATTTTARRSSSCSPAARSASRARSRSAGPTRGRPCARTCRRSRRPSRGRARARGP